MLSFAWLYLYILNIRRLWFLFQSETSSNVFKKLGLLSQEQNAAVVQERAFFIFIIYIYYIILLLNVN